MIVVRGSFNKPIYLYANFTHAVMPWRAARQCVVEDYRRAGRRRANLVVCIHRAGTKDVVVPYEQALTLHTRLVRWPHRITVNVMTLL